jgi:CrcB protein
LGGAIGAVARWKLSGAVLHHTIDWRFPLATFIVNVFGCLIAGVLAGLVTKLDFFTPDTRLFLFTGLLGGFTTFSAFGIEVVYLLRRNEYGVALAYIVLSVVIGIAATWFAMLAVHGKATSVG